MIANRFFDRWEQAIDECDPFWFVAGIAVGVMFWPIAFPMWGRSIYQRVTHPCRTSSNGHAASAAAT